MALDLVNTDVDAQGDRSTDVLRNATEFLAWCEHIGVPVPGAAPRDARAVTAPAARLRTALRAVIEAMLGGRTAPAEALATLQAACTDAITRSRPVIEDRRLVWEHDAAEPTSVVDRLALAAVDLLREGPVDRLKACPSCGFLFLDTTKNHSRRWCSMEDCGKEEKMRRYVARRAEARSHR
ncbi:CGNR zinc finger domain-containing protein [Xylanimonas sp. McL0601]|uniref:CGNR zinc finger domain-containing protein n=1 Tax=Xylanimonas sp. McL0601 TaxID=3414739 RepID=UPI003CE96518